MWFKLRNFKGYVDSGWIKLQPLILIFGKNSSGKSAIIQGLRLINELAPRAYRYDSFRDFSVPLKGPDYDYGDFKQAVHGQNEDTCIGFSFRVEDKGRKNKRDVIGNPDWMRPNKFDLHLDFSKLTGDPHVATCKNITIDCEELFIGDSLFRLIANICDLSFEEDESGEGDELYDEYATEIDGWKIQNLAISLEKADENFLEVSAGSKRMRPFAFERKLFEISPESLQDIYEQTIPMVNSLELSTLSWSSIDTTRRYFADLERGNLFVTLSNNEFEALEKPAKAGKFVSTGQRKSEPEVGFELDFENISENMSELLDGRTLDFVPVRKIGSDDEFSNLQFESGMQESIGVARLATSLLKRTLRQGLVRFGNVTRIPAFRGEPKRSEASSSYAVNSPLSAAIAALSDDKQLLNRVVADFELLDIDLNLEPQKVQFAGETRSSLGLLPKSVESVSLALTDVGFGVGQILPILTALHDKDSLKFRRSMFHPLSKRIMLIEEPETHLHPSLQGDLIQLIASDSGAATSTKTQESDDWNQKPRSEKSLWIIETHSENMASRVQKLVNKGVLNPESISFLFCEGGNNGSILREIKIDDNGQLEEDWPNNFIETRLERMNNMN